MNIIIRRKHEIFKLTGSGKNWKSKPEETEESIVSEEFYNNFVESIRFFNRFGYGAYCRAYKGYTYIGYKPIKVITVSPGRDTKLIDTFSFEIKH